MQMSSKFQKAKDQLRVTIMKLVTMPRSHHQEFTGMNSILLVSNHHHSAISATPIKAATETACPLPQENEDSTQSTSKSRTNSEAPTTATTKEDCPKTTQNPSFKSSQTSETQ